MLINLYLQALPVEKVKIPYHEIFKYSKRNRRAVSEIAFILLAISLFGYGVI